MAKPLGATGGGNSDGEVLTWIDELKKVIPNGESLTADSVVGQHAVVAEIDGKPQNLIMDVRNENGELWYSFSTASVGEGKKQLDNDKYPSLDSLQSGQVNFQNSDNYATGTVTNRYTVGDDTTNTLGSVLTTNGHNSVDDPYMHDSLMNKTNVTVKKVLDNKVYATKEEAVSELVSSGQWLGKDADYYVTQMATQGNITINAERNYYSTKYKNLNETIKGFDHKTTAASLRSEVSNLRAEFDTVRVQMESWLGSASEEALDAVKNIIDKFDVTMGNIEMALEPACQAIDDLKKDLETLETEDAKLKTLEAELTTLNEQLASTPPTRTRFDGWDVDEKGRKTAIYRTETNPAYTALQEAVKAKQDEVNKQKELLDQLILKIENEYKLIQNLQTVIKTFKSLTGRAKSTSSWEGFYKDYDYYLDSFSDYDLNPVITNLLDYAEGDIVNFDDNYGIDYLFKGFTPEGYAILQAVDANGNILAGSTEITITDPREIIPVGKTEKPVISDVIGNGGGGGRTPTPDSPTPNPPTPNPPTPDPPTPDPPTPDPPTPNPPPEPDRPLPPDPVVPDPTPIPTPEPFIPNTGIDGVAQNVSKSSATLTGLAGLAMGAAGLGLTSTMKKDEDDDDDDSDKKSNDENIDLKEKEKQKKEDIIEEIIKNDAVFPNQDLNIDNHD